MHEFGNTDCQPGFDVSGTDSSYLCHPTMHAELTEPPPLSSGDSSAVDSARKRLIKSKRLTLGLARLPNLRALWAGRTSRILREQSIFPDDTTSAEIDLNVDDSFDDLNVRQDINIYKWAVVYENQRGCEL